MNKSKRIFPISPYPNIAKVSEGIKYDRLRKPTGVSVELVTQDIYVLELYTKEVKVYSRSADYRFKFPLSTARADVLCPYNLAVYNCLVFISDYDKGIVSVFSLHGDYVTSFNRGLYRMLYAKGITTDSQGDLYVCDSGNDRVVAYAHTLPLTFQYLHHDLLDPRDVRVFDDNIYVMDSDILNLKVFAYSGELVRIIQIQTHRFFSTFFAVDSSGHLIFSDQGGDCLQVFSLDGKFLQTIGRRGMYQPGEFNIPRGVTVDASDGIVTVSLKSNCIIQIF